MRTRARTLAALGLLGAVMPANLALTTVALARRRAWDVTARPDRRTILLSGGKMTKALTLARAFHRAGHRVVLADTARYRFSGHRFSRAVDAFHTLPDAASDGYRDALIELVRREGVDVYVPVCSPVSSAHDARVKAELSEHCDVLHLDAGALHDVDDKHAFAVLARSLDLDVPDAHLITDPEQVVDFDFDAHPGPYVLKSIPYDPVRRLDLTPLPLPTREQTARFVRGLPISGSTPWVMQAYVEGQEYCTHSTVRDGRVTVHTTCESSAFQLNYDHIDDPEIERWVRTLAEAGGYTGQLSFDFMRGRDGRLVAIECNPRTHSAITLFAEHPQLADAYLADDPPQIRPPAGQRPTFWTYWELWRLLTHSGRRATLARLREGTDAIFAWEDPLPFLAVHHLQIPALLVGSLVRGTDWVRIDFNIGKLVEPAGD